MFSFGNSAVSGRLVVPCALAALALAACSSSGSSSPSSTPTPSASNSVSTVAFDQTIQQELNAVGCKAGPVDGDIGPVTDAAIVAFQQASGLASTGELNAETDQALKAATTAGKTVCTAAPAPTATVTTVAGATCTAASINAALPAGTPTTISYQCADGWAAAASGPNNTGSTFLQIEGNQWVVVKGQACMPKNGFQPPNALISYCNGS